MLSYEYDIQVTESISVSVISNHSKEQVLEAFGELLESKSLPALFDQKGIYLPAYLVGAFVGKGLISPCIINNKRSTGDYPKRVIVPIIFESLSNSLIPDLEWRIQND